MKNCISVIFLCLIFLLNTSLIGKEATFLWYSPSKLPVRNITMSPGGYPVITSYEPVKKGFGKKTHMGIAGLNPETGEGLW
jgi:hypothetical protein